MKSVLVIGESCIDEFIYCDAKRLAPDIPVPVLNVVNKVENHGMASNVHRNLRSLGVPAYIESSHFTRIRKTRYVHNDTNHTFFRVDEEDPTICSNMGDIIHKIQGFDIVVISDYDKGYLKASDIAWIGLEHDCVFVDTKKPLLSSWTDEVTFIKVNDFEYNASKDFMNAEAKQKIIHTMGSKGAEYQGVHYPVDPVEIRDVSGAGDTFLAALVAHYAKGGTIEEGIKFANKCASEVVKHRGVTVV